VLYVTATPRRKKHPFGCNGYVTAVAEAKANGFILKCVMLIINVNGTIHCIMVWESLTGTCYPSPTPRDLHRRRLDLKISPLAIPHPM
jgi:hypothetical protein